MNDPALPSRGIPLSPHGGSVFARRDMPPGQPFDGAGFHMRAYEHPRAMETPR